MIVSCSALITLESLNVTVSICLLKHWDIAKMGVIILHCDDDDDDDDDYSSRHAA